MTCLVLGDSIATGLAPFFKGCLVAAKVGLASPAVVAIAPAGPFAWAVVSVGSNPASGDPTLAQNVARIKDRIATRRIVWIEPANHAAARRVVCSAGPCVGFAAGRDGVHPRSYSALARSVLAALGGGNGN